MINDEMQLIAQQEMTNKNESDIIKNDSNISDQEYSD